MYLPLLAPRATQRRDDHQRLGDIAILFLLLLSLQLFQLVPRCQNLVCPGFVFLLVQRMIMRLTARPYLIKVFHSAARCTSRCVKDVADLPVYGCV